MQNNTRFAEDVRNGVDNMLDALANTDSMRKSHLRTAGQWLMHAVDEANTPEEKDLVDVLFERLGEMRKNLSG